ncbi:hypothetical protein B0H17DRAFT_1334094 [Mycena rosella]|uniref:Aprataxin and PNK-like factor PBZ domain-containing protein n=1 Tax=Mycena rosella TaxID=1033263 RepID=A0AAD7D851_MYCRO|nr:hypothetical protein B0H17DRAFT_1334094 [Mycena rosella]
MRALSALPLDDDIVDRVMTFCPSFSCLQATILVSKAFYRVFQTHPKAITRAVAYNIVGPGLPQALRVLRYPPYNGPDADAIEMAEACREEHGASVITAEEKQKLRENAEIVGKLEDIYSLTTKDRTSKRSVLTSEESWRFRRAAYRIMLYCSVFPGNRYEFDEIEALDDQQIEKIRGQRTAMLNRYQTDELLELFSVVKFIQGILSSVVDDDQSNMVDILLSTGPEGAVLAWEERSYDALEMDLLGDGLLHDDEDNKLFAGYFTLTFENIWTRRNLKPPKEEDPASKWVLDEVIGANDTCSQCAAPGGLQLLTSANWDRFPVSPTACLKNKLKSNASIIGPFAQATAHLANLPSHSLFLGIHNAVNQAALGAWITEIFDVRRAPGFEVADGWDVGASYCAACLSRFLEEHVWVWFLEERVKSTCLCVSASMLTVPAAGWVPPEDCWYGYNCNTQTHKAAHQTGKNHLCVPTRGSA